ncbi:MAG: leucine-rich repeat domain-containing protein [Lachnospiraceae bacterium]|nr:leucine-rich repeat domain-containing protein [Lachnospiraceae bacterium]
MRSLKKVTALMLAAVVSLSSFTTAFAATSSVTAGVETEATTTTDLCSTNADGTAKNTIVENSDGTNTATLTAAADKDTVIIKTVTATSTGTTYTITQIAKNAFKDSSATTVRFAKKAKVKTIKKKAFANSKVKTVVFKSTVTKIEKNAFKNSSVKTIKIKGLSTKKAKALRKKLRAAGYTGTIKIVK